PLYQKGNVFANFDPDAYDPVKRVFLYQPVLVNGLRRARNPVTGEVGLPVGLIGSIVPGVGSVSDGLVFAGQNGVPRGLIKNRSSLSGPRFGFAYAVNNNTVFRAGGGVFYERIATSAMGYTTNFYTNPPDVQLSQIFHGNLSTIATSSGLFPLQIPPISKDGHVPTVYNFSAGIQRQLPLQILFAMSYVGTPSRHLIVAT